jgi:hypothetical protein
MAVVFPPNPNVGDQVTDPSTGAIWEWDGVRWIGVPSGGVSADWKPHPDWWDIRAIMQAGTLAGNSFSNYRFGVVLRDLYVTAYLDPYYEWFTSDGTHYAEGAGGWHVWNTSYDRPCSLGYVTRCAVACGGQYGSPYYMSMDANQYAVLHVHLAAYAWAQIILGGQSQVEALTADAGATTTPDAIVYYHGTAAARRLDLPPGLESTYLLCLSSGVQRFVIPDTVTYCGPYTLFGTNQLRYPKLSANLQTFDDIAFPYSAYDELVIPASVQAVQDLAFDTCAYLRRVTFEGIPQTYTGSPFNSCTALSTFTVPNGWKHDLLLHRATLSLTSLAALVAACEDRTGQAALNISVPVGTLDPLPPAILTMAANKNINLTEIAA